METKTYAIRQLPEGYKLTSVEKVKCHDGTTRKFSSDTTDLIYKRKEFAEKKAHSFYRHCYGYMKLEYIGVIGLNDYKGEVA